MSLLCGCLTWTDVEQTNPDEAGVCVGKREQSRLPSRIKRADDRLGASQPVSVCGRCSLKEEVFDILT